MLRDELFRTTPAILAYSLLMIAASLACPAASGPGQVTDVPLRNWPAPAYWMPSHPATAPSGTAPAGAKPALGDPRSGSVTPLTGPLVLIGITPCRMVDTRAFAAFPAPFGGPAFTANEIRSFPLRSHPNCLIPPNAKAFSLNLLAISPGPLQWLSAWPDGYPYPNTSFLNGSTAGLYNNAVIIAAGVNGGISVLAASPADLIIDINGYYVEWPESNRTLGGVVSSNGTAQSLPPGSTSSRAGTGQYVITFPANTFPAGSSPAPVLSPIGAIATLQGASVVRLSDGSGTLAVTWSNDVTFSFVLAPN